MPRTSITPQSATAAAPRAAVTFTAVDAANGNAWAFTGRRRLLVENGSGASVTATIRTRDTVAVAGLDVADRPVIIPAGGIAYIVESAEARQADGRVWIDWSAGTSVTCALIDEG